MSNFTGPSNSKVGKSFEEIFFKQAQLSGLLPIKNHIACQVTFKGRLQPVKALRGELDYRLISQRGKVGWFDCKAFSEDYFTYSMINEEQLERSLLYADYKVPSGFVVYFQKGNIVCFFSGKAIQKKGPRTRFDKSDALILGTIFNFDLSLIMKARI